ncbi:MAG: hypothetical protein I3273_06040 [Candidatus Moeniiplasma glomeromycotorum]|nr:hypothetical protein [Candidatus Moeniiplasma glomeromycotorum]MCE8168101.1 hypothetical protein [Candidatus Moeniiplasma glomeromycotorum]MCE8169645.1 hypothetical protein [Candidatus Moeniiplasma glomeromycotorum]
MDNENLKENQQKSNEKKTREKWWNEDMRIKNETEVPDLPIFLLNANLERNRGWIYFVMLNLSQDKEETKIKLLRLFFLIRNFPKGILKKNFPRDVEIWEDLKKRLDEDWKKFSNHGGFYQHYRLEKKGVDFRLFFSKFSGKNSEFWKEWKTLSKASFAYNFHLLGEVICNTISFFSEVGKTEKLSASEENQFKVEFDIEPEKVPDILITSEKNKEEKLGIEVVEVSSSSIKQKEKDKEENLEKHIHGRTEKQANNSIKKNNKIEIKPIKDIEEIEMGEIEEKDDIFTYSLKVSKKINNINYLMKKLRENIEIKNKKWEEKKFGNLTLWTILSANFTMYLYHADNGHQAVKDPEMQKDFLSWFLLKKIHESLNDIEIKKIDFLIITFLNADYCRENNFLNKHDPIIKVEWEMVKEKSMILKHISSNNGVKVVIPNFYIPVRNGKIRNLEEILRAKEENFKKKWNLNINSISHEEFGFDSYTFLAQDLEKNNNA